MIGQMIGWAVFGLVAGALARLLHPGRDPMNWVWTMALGIGGALLGGWIGAQLGFNTGSGIGSWVAAIAGSILLLVLYHLVTAHRPSAADLATNDAYKHAVFDDLSRGPKG